VFLSCRVGSQIQNTRSRDERVSAAGVLIVGGTTINLRRSLLPSWSVLNRLSQMRRGALVTSGQIGNCAGYFEEAMEYPLRKLQLLHHRVHERLAGRIKPATDADIDGRHVGILVSMVIAARIHSADSLTAVSGGPIRVNVGSPCSCSRLRVRGRLAG